MNALCFFCRASSLGICVLGDFFWTRSRDLSAVYSGLCALGSSRFSLYWDTCVDLVCCVWSITQPLTVGIMFQMICVVLMMSFCVLCALAMKTELMQHRIFLLTLALATALMNTYMHLPFWVHICMGAPAIYIAWLSFHGLVGFWPKSMIVYGVVFIAFLPTFISTWVERLKWKQFHTHQQLERERRTLEETQAALHRMLSIMWDASCTCTADGKIISSTPHLEQLFRGGSDLVGSDMCAFAANDMDVRRLRDFLENTARSAMNQALSLQCTMRPQFVGSSQEKIACDLDATLYGIRISSDAALNTLGPTSGHEKLFLGIKASLPDVHVPDAVHAAPLVTTIYDKDPTGNVAQKSIAESHAELSSLYSSNEEFIEDVKHPHIGRNRMPATAASTCSGLSFTVSSASLSSCRLKCTTQCQATQTEVAPLRSRLPLMPGSARDKGRPHVSLNTKKRMKPMFAVTPDSTVSQCVAEMVCRFNRRGKGCCPWHVGLTSLNRRISRMIAEPCLQQLVADMSEQQYQCTVCQILNCRDDEPPLDGALLICDICGTEHATTLSSLQDSSSESARADDA